MNMSKKAYQAEFGSGKRFAKARLPNQPVSLKYSTELCREIKGKRLDKMVKWIERIIMHEDWLPLRRYVKKIGHRKGQSKSFTKTGRYPEKTLGIWKKMLETVKANADYKGLDSENLMIVHAFASQGYARMGYQSQGRIAGKRRAKKAVHLEVVVREAK